MKVLVYGATGMIGQGVLRECLLDAKTKSVFTIGRTATGEQNRKLHEIVRADLFDYADIESRLTGFDACFFCLGMTSSGRTEAQYSRVTYDLTLAAAETLIRLNPGMTFVYISAAGADSTEKSRLMWTRIRGRTENALLRLPFKAAYMIRPGIVQPLYGATSRTTLYRIFYTLSSPIMPVLRLAFPNQVLTTEEIGLAMLWLTRNKWPAPILESRDVRAVCSKIQ